MRGWAIFREMMEVSLRWVFEFEAGSRGKVRELG